MSDEEEKYEKVHRNKINPRKRHRSYVTRVIIQRSCYFDF